MYPAAKFHRNDFCLRTATGEPLEPHSYVMVNVSYRGQRRHLRLYFVNEYSFLTLLGRSRLRQIQLDWSVLTKQQTCYQHTVATEKPGDSLREKALDLVKTLLKKCENLTKPGIGCIKSMEAKLELNSDNPHPVYRRARPVAHAMIPLADEELSFMEKYRVNLPVIGYTAFSLLGKKP